MVVPIPNTPNTNQPKQNNNINVNISPNLVKPIIENPMVNPNFGKDIKIHGLNNTYSIDVNYSTDLTHPELAPKNPLVNPVLEKMKTLSPVQEITIIGRGTDPEAIANNPTKVNPYVREKEQTAETLVKTQTTNINNSESVLGPFVKAFNSSDVNQILQITGGLTLPELFQILGLDINSFVPHNRGNTINGPNSWSYVGSQANVSFSGNSITFYRQYANDVRVSKWYDYYTNNQQITVKPYYYTYKGKTYKLVEVIFKNNIQNNNTGGYSDNTYYHYYIIDPVTKQILYSGSSEHPIVNMSKLNSSITGDLIQPGKEIEDILQQYGYQLTQQEIQEINNLQKGQSITVGNPNQGQTPIKITYEGGDAYEIESLGEFYTQNGQEIAINEKVTVPTYSINTVGGEVMTTGIDVSGDIYEIIGGRYKPFVTETYSVNESIPTFWNYSSGQLTFSFGKTLGGVNLQSINAPTLTYQQYIQLANGQIPSGIKPGWYYYPTLNEFVQVSYQTVQQPQVNWNSLWGGYSSIYQNNPYWFGYSSIQQKTNKPQILQDSFFTPSMISGIWNGITIIGQDIYNGITSLFSSQKPINPNTYNFNYPIGYNTQGSILYRDLTNAYQDIQNWYENNNKQYLQTMKLASEHPINWGQILERINQPGEITTPTGQKADLIQFTIPAIGPASVADFVGIFGDTGDTISEIGGTLARLFTNFASPKTLANIIIGAGESWGSGELISLAETGKPLPTKQALSLAEQGSIIGAFAGELSALSGSSSPFWASIGEQFTPWNFFKNLGLNIAGNVGVGNILSLATQGKPLKLQQDIYGIEEAGPATLAFSTIAGIFESPYLANNFLKLVTSENSNKYWPIIARIGYDVGANFLAGTTSSLAAQGVGNLIGAQQGINWNEALDVGLFAGALTGLGESFSAFRNPGGFVKSFGYYPQEYDIENINAVPIRNDFDENSPINVDVYGYGYGKYAPKLGNRFYTDQDFSNIKSLIKPFSLEGNVNVYQGYIINNEENPEGIATLFYEGNFKTIMDDNIVTARAQGIIPLKKIATDNLEQYQTISNDIVSAISKSKLQFSELQTVPQQGLTLVNKAFEGDLIDYVEGSNINVPNPRYLDWQYPLSRLQTGEWVTNFAIPEKAFPVPIGGYETEYIIAPREGFDLNTGLLYETRVPLGGYIVYPGEEDVYSIYRTKVPIKPNLNENVNSVLIFREMGAMDTSLGKAYRTSMFGVGATYETGESSTDVSGITTVGGFSEEIGTKKVFGFVGQSGSVNEPDFLHPGQSTQITFGYLKGIDPNLNPETVMQTLGNLQLTGPTAEIKPQDIISALQESSKNKVVLPENPPIIKTYPDYGFSIINSNYSTNQNIINQNSNYNIGMSRLPNVNGNQQKINKIQNQYVEHPELNIYNIQNGLNRIQNTFGNTIWTSNNGQSTLETINPLEKYGRNSYYKLQPPGIENIESQNNSIISRNKPLESGKNSLRKEENKMKSLRNNENIGQLIIPEIGLAAFEVYRQETDKTLTTTTTTRTRFKIPLPPPTKPKPTTPIPPIPPTTPPREFSPFGFPEISVMGMPINGLAPGFGRGVRSMYDIQYALSRLQW